jgi:integrase
MNNELSKLMTGITSYWSRHTWATIAASLDVPDDVISLALGHSARNATTAIYIERDRKKIDKANRRVIDWVWYGKK